MNNEKYEVGDWVLITYETYDFTGSKYYISEIIGDKINFNPLRRSMFSDGMWISEEQLKTINSTYIGRGKRKWYWRWLPWRELVCPFYYPNESNIQI